MYGCVTPIVCPPKCCVRDCYIPRVVPVIHPIVTVNRQNIVDVPRHIYQPMTTNVVVDRGFQGYPGYPGYPGYQGAATRRLFF